MNNNYHPTNQRELQNIPLVYIVLGIDAHGHDQVLAVCSAYEVAKDYCRKCECTTEYYDLWIEKHQLL